MHIKCPSCQKVLQIADNMAGRHARCPLCSQVFTVSPPAGDPSAGVPVPKLETMRRAPPPPTPATVSDAPAIDNRQLLNLVVSAQADIEKSLEERDEAMELVDSYFQLFMQRAENADLSPEEQQECRNIAQNLFQLQKKFPLLSGFKAIFQECERALRG